MTFQSTISRSSLILKIGITLAVIASFLFITPIAEKARAEESAAVIEKFLEEHPDAVVAVCVIYYENGSYEYSTASSGVTSTDPFSLSKSHLIPASELYEAGILSHSQWIELLRRADATVDLVDKSFSRSYTDKYRIQEIFKITDQLGLKIIDAFFDGIYDGLDTKNIKKKNPAFYLQLSCTDELRIDTEEDARLRIDDIDPTPPLEY